MSSTLTSSPLTPASCRRLSDLLRRWSGVSIEPNKEYLISGRLKALFGPANGETLDELLNHAERPSGTQLRNRIVDAMTTHETLFFRDGHPFETVVDQMIPGMLADRPNTQKLAIHCAACSSGQEPYSLAMRLAENSDPISRGRIELHASDVSVGTIAQAKRGEFMDHELRRGLSAGQRRRFFELADIGAVGCDMVLKAEIRSQVRFSVLNLTSPMDFGRLRGTTDIVFCRNVLIYFDDDTRRTALRNLHGMLRPGGYLLLGSSEMLRDNQGLFETQRIGKTTVQARIG